MCRSVPQIEAARTRTSTSAGPIVGTETASRSAPRAGRAFRRAFMVVVGIKRLRRAPELTTQNVSTRPARRKPPQNRKTFAPPSATIAAGLASVPCSAPARRHSLSVAQRLQEIREGFQPAFWVANVSELFERLSYYGVYAVLAIYLHETLGLTEARAGDLIGFFGGVVWFLPIIGGTLADRFGFRRSLAFAYLVLALGYFLLGSL